MWMRRCAARAGRLPSGDVSTARSTIARHRVVVLVAALLVAALLVLTLTTWSGGDEASAGDQAASSGAGSGGAAAGDGGGDGTDGAGSGASAGDASAADPSATQPEVVESGNGRIAPVQTWGEDSERAGREIRWSVEAEQGLGLDLDQFATAVRRTLVAEKGWEAATDVHFVRVPAWQVEQGARVDVRVTLASPETTDELCAPLQTGGRVSCWRDGRAVINSYRWVKGAGTFRGRIWEYRTYLINHEVGHGLGFSHEACPGEGSRAPVMLQQTLRLDGCWAWETPADDGSRLR